MLALWCRRSLQSKMLPKQGQGSPQKVDVPQTFQTFQAPVTRKRSKAEKEAENVEKAGVAAWLNFNFLLLLISVSNQLDPGTGGTGS